MPHKAPPASDRIAHGTAPDGRKVVFYEADRPGTLSHVNNHGILVLAIDEETGEKLTHSDTLNGLVSAGYKVAAAVPPPLSKDGPTLEEYVKAGYTAESYPPAGFAEKPSHGLDAFKKASAAKLKDGSAQHSGGK